MEHGVRAALVQRYGPADTIELVDQPVPEPAPGQVSIDVVYAGVNYAEVMARRGSLPVFVPPFIPGLEVSGTVRAVGQALDGFAVGDPVCALTTRGGYAEVAVAPGAVTYRLAGNLASDLERAAAMPTIVPTAHALIREVARLRAGEQVLVHAAAGGVGTVLGQLAKRSGAGAVFGVVSTQAKADFATGYGYDEIFVGSDWDTAAMERTGGRGLDVVFDSVGGDVRSKGFEVLAPLGRLVAYGNACDDPEIGFPGGLMRSKVRGMLGFSTTALAVLDPTRARAIGEAAFAEAAAADLAIPITGVYPLEEAWRAHELLEGRSSTGKPLLSVM
jgi:NADPH2:quinone reductase